MLNIVINSRPMNARTTKKKSRHDPAIERMIATWVPVDEAERIKDEAAARGLNIANYLRFLLHEARRGTESNDTNKNR